MAATAKPNKIQQDRTRAAIKTTQLVKRLQQFALDEDDDQGSKVDLDQARLKAIEVLLKKTLPDLRSIEHTGEGGGPVQFTTIYEAKS